MSNKMKEVAELLGVKLYEKFFTTEDEKFYYFTDNRLMCGNYVVNSSDDYPVSDTLVHLLNGNYKIIRIIPDKLVEKAIQGKKLNSKEYELILYNCKFLNMECIESFVNDCGTYYNIFKCNDKFYQMNYSKTVDNVVDFTHTKIIQVIPIEIKRTIWREVK